jgi:secreted PhoX family phosphatase
MGRRHILAGGLAAAALCLATLGAAQAADITYAPATISYGTHSTTKVTGLTPRTAYALQIYNPSGVPLIPGGVPVLADATGTGTSTALDPDQTDLPGMYLFEVTSGDGKVVARTSPTLTGTNTYYRQKRLGA